jgi:hypothetical protein
MENKVSYYPMDAAMQQELRAKYVRPFKRNIITLVSTLLLIYLLIIVGQFFFTDQSSGIAWGPFLVVTIGFLLVFLMAYPKFKNMNIHFLKDAESGRIAKAQVHIINVFDTPSGINIYWLDSPVIKSFTPEPYRTFRNGDVVVIYYLEHAAQYLAYELPAND